MAAKWPIQPLEEVAELRGGFAFKSEDYASDGQFILRTLNIKEDGSITRNDGVFLPLEKSGLYERFELKEHDTLFVMVGATLGKVGYIRREILPALLNQNMWLIRGRDGICDKRYLQYAFRHSVAKNLGWASGSARDFVRRDDYRKMKIPVPPLAEQCTIAHILGTLDDKIELNRSMNETLEAMTRALFKSWFVDFDPVRAKAEGRDSGLPKEIADLFPESFEDSEIGEIPRGWRVGTLGDVADHPRRGVQPNEIEPSTPYIALEHMPRRCIALGEWSTADGLESNKFEFKKGEILFGKLRPYFHKVGVAPVDGVCSTDIVVVTPRTQEWFHFVLGHVSSETFVEYTNAGSTGTKMPRTNWGDMARYAVAIPPEPVAEAFSNQLHSAIDRIISGIYESRTLATLRDLLLPKLLSGEIRIAGVKNGVAG